LITNIPAPLLAKAGWRTGMTLEFDAGAYVMRAKFGDRYNSVPKGDFVVLLNSQGLLEIARNMDSAGDSLGAVAGQTIEIRTAGTLPASAPEDTGKAPTPKVVPPTTKS
jgi:S-adenosylmethionine hydrolase